MDHKKLLRLYRGETLPVRRRGGRKRALGTRAPIRLPEGPNERWSLDFVSDAYDHVRSHLSLGGATPAEVASRRAPQWDAGHAPHPIAIIAHQGHQLTKGLCF